MAYGNPYPGLGQARRCGGVDYTLWPFWVDTHVDLPFKKDSNGKVYDKYGKHVKFYTDVPQILEDLSKQGFKLGIASRTSSIQEAQELVELFKWKQYFHYSEIYPGCKIDHFKRFQQQSGLPYKDMLFFDDEYRNIRDVGSLDYTLWPFWVDDYGYADTPFKKDSNGKVYDKYGKHVEFYSDVPQILEDLSKQGFKLGIASRTSSIQEAQELVELFKWKQYFHYSEIYPGCKIDHFKKFQQQSGLPYKDMLFFDDEYRNIRDVGSLGVTCIHAEDGVSRSVIDEGFKTFAMKKH